MLATYKEPRYTESQWNIIKTHEKNRKKSIAAYYIKQKLSGIALITIGICIPLLFNEATPSLIVIPLGLYLLSTDKRIMTF